MTKEKLFIPIHAQRFYKVPRAVAWVKMSSKRQKKKKTKGTSVNNVREAIAEFT